MRIQELWPSSLFSPRISLMLVIKMKSPNDFATFRQSDKTNRFRATAFNRQYIYRLIVRMLKKTLVIHKVKAFLCEIDPFYHHSHLISLKKEDAYYIPLLILNLFSLTTSTFATYIVCIHPPPPIIKYLPSCLRQLWWSIFYSPKSCMKIISHDCAIFEFDATVFYLKLKHTKNFFYSLLSFIQIHQKETKNCLWERFTS